MAAQHSTVLSPLVFALLVLLLWFPVTDAVRTGRINALRRWQPVKFSLNARRPKPETMTPSCNGSAVGRPSAIQCPEACPYLRAETTEICSFACVASEHCQDENPLSSFANPKTMRCEGCHATACTTCKTAWTCAVCQPGFILKRGYCKSPNNIYWYILYVFLGIIGVPVVIYAVRLPLRDQVNEEVLEKALVFRENSKVLDKENHLPFDLGNTNLGDHVAAGAGLALHFKWQQVVFLWACIIFAVLVMLQFFFHTRPSAIKHDPGTAAAFKACELQIHTQADHFQVMEKAYFWIVLFIYVITTIGSIMHAVGQRRRSKTMTDEDITMGDYALLASGFPSKPGAEDVESEIKQFFEQTFPDLTIIGVSVCWDLKDSKTKSWVQEKCNNILRQLDCEDDETHGEGNRQNMEMIASSSLAVGPNEGRSTCDPELKCFDAVFGIGMEEAKQNDQEVEEEVKKVHSSGWAYVVFGTEQQCKTALAASKKNPETLVFHHQGNKHNISLEHTGAEPETVLWENFGQNYFYIGICLSVLAIIVIVICLDIFFYAPYVVYLNNYANVKGKVGGDFLQGFLLGLLITVCNQVIYQVIAFISGKLGFLRVGTQMQFYVVGYTVSIFVNTCVDLWTVMLLAQGVSQQDLVTTMGEASATTGESGVLSIKSIAEHPAIQRSVYTQLLTYLFPGCLLVPFMMEPLAANILLYWLPVWLVRSRPEVGMFEAETRLAAPLFDLSRYGDITVNIALCLLALFFTYRDLYMVFGWLIISIILIYAWDHYRFLRCCRQAYFASPNLDRTKDYLMAACCGIIAASLVFRAWAASDAGFLEGMRELWDGVVTAKGVNKLWRLWLLIRRETILWHVFVTFILHCVGHFSLLYWLVPKLEGGDAEHDIHKEYEEVAQTTPCTWFNSNPMFALRSKYFFKHEPFAIPVMTGKEYLLKKNENLGMHYEKNREEFMNPAKERARTSIIDTATMAASSWAAVQRFRPSMKENLEGNDSRAQTWQAEPRRQGIFGSGRTSTGGSGRAFTGPSVTNPNAGSGRALTDPTRTPVAPLTSIHET